MSTDDTSFEHTGRIIRDEIRIAAAPDAVYRAWADPDTITGWFVGRMEGRMEPGQSVTWLWDDGGPGMTQTVVVAEPPERIVTAMELPQGVSYLEVTIEQDGGHSVLRLVQSGFGEGPEWDDEYEGMLSGWMMALGALKFFLERYAGRQRHEVLVLGDAPFEQADVLHHQRELEGLTQWLAESGSVGQKVGEPVRLVLENGQTLTGVVLRATDWETLWSWKEMDAVVEHKAFRGARWGSKVGVRVSSWADRADTLMDLKDFLEGSVGKLAGLLSQVAS